MGSSPKDQLPPYPNATPISDASLKYDEDVQEVEEQDVPKKKFTKRAERQNWLSEQEVALAKSWIQISTCKEVGNEQSKDGFWKRILEHYKKITGTNTRTTHSLNTKWNTMNGAMIVFNGLYIQLKRLQASGCSDVDVMKNVMADYQKKIKKVFSHIEAWEVVRVHDKWLEQSCVGQEAETHSDKRRKSPESDNYESGSNGNYDTILPKVNENATPARERKFKKKERASSSKASVAETIDSYTAKKTQLMMEQAEKRRQKDELVANLLVEQLEGVKERNFQRDFKFFTDSHDHITDPMLLEVVLGKKRQYASKYGWPCNF